MFDDACLSELGYYGRPMVVKALNDICSFGEVGCYLLYLFFLCFEEEALLVCCMLRNSFKTIRCDFEVPLPFADFKKSLTCAIALL